VYTDKQLQRLDLSLFCATCSSLRDRRNHHSPAAPLSSLPASYTPFLMSASYTPFLMSVIAASSAALLVTRDWTKYQYYQVETRACRCSCSGQVSAKLGKQLAAPLSVSFCLLEFASIYRRPPTSKENASARVASKSLLYGGRPTQLPAIIFL